MQLAIESNFRPVSLNWNTLDRDRRINPLTVCRIHSDEFAVSQLCAGTLTGKQTIREPVNADPPEGGAGRQAAERICLSPGPRRACFDSEHVRRSRPGAAE